QRSQMFKRNSISYIIWRSTIDLIDFDQREIFFTFFWRSNFTRYGVTGFQTEASNLRMRNINIVWRRYIVIIRRSSEATVIWHNFQTAFSCDDSFELIISCSILILVVVFLIGSLLFMLIIVLLLSSLIFLLIVLLLLIFI